MEPVEHKWYHPLIPVLHIISVLLWSFFLIYSIIHKSPFWILLVWIVLLIITASNIYTDRHLFRHYFQKKK